MVLSATDMEVSSPARAASTTSGFKPSLERKRSQGKVRSDNLQPVLSVFYFSLYSSAPKTQASAGLAGRDGIPIAAPAMVAWLRYDVKNLHTEDKHDVEGLDTYNNM